ncbi:hypothetical protein RND71_043530 [Anisodus tanguticus]|uniref:RCC1-like domain-containing protein n=1 Tax=Anisodus tanguticus TaxID=243964 RepID=A0AAE1UTT9_9SOLA|nr:hypothetical protein RND71_043530 [Anisodus tanguticus]
MPPRKNTKIVTETESTEIKDEVVKRSTRSTRQTKKREIVEEVVVDTKKKKVTDKPVKETKRKKDVPEKVEKIEIEGTKRKRTLSKEAVKTKTEEKTTGKKNKVDTLKEVKESINEEVTTVKLTTGRGRRQNNLISNKNDEEIKKKSNENELIKKPSRTKKVEKVEKETDSIDSESNLVIDETVSDKKTNSKKTETNESVKNSKEKLSDIKINSDENEVVNKKKVSPIKRSTRGRKAKVVTEDEEKVKESPVKKVQQSKKVVENVEEVEKEEKKTKRKTKKETTVEEKPLELVAEPEKKTRGRAAKKVVNKDEEENTKTVEQPVKKTRGKAPKRELEPEKVLEIDELEEEKELVIDLNEDTSKKSKSKKGKEVSSSNEAQINKKTKKQEEPVENLKKNTKRKTPVENVEEQKTTDETDNVHVEENKRFNKRAKKKTPVLVTDIKEDSVKSESLREKASAKTVVEKAYKEKLSKDVETNLNELDNSKNEEILENEKEISDKKSCEEIKETEILNVIEDMKSIVENTILSESSSCSDSTKEIISAKELEDYAKDSSNEDFKLTFGEVSLKIDNCKSNENLTEKLSFTENETNVRKKIKLFSTETLKLPELEDGKVLVFGEDIAGELGLGEVGLSKAKPVQLKIDDEICYINTLSQHSVLINKKGQLYTFGNNDECALGRTTADKPDQEELEATPTIFDLDKFKIYKATTGDSHTAILSIFGTVFYWGNFRDPNGKVGLTTNQLNATGEPFAINPELTVVDIASGANFLLVLDSFGDVYSLGIGDRGELGRLNYDELKFNKNERSKYLELHIVDFPKNVKIDRIWCGEFTAFARSTDNRIFSWGLNNFCQLGFKSENNKQDLCVLKPKEVSFFTKLGHVIEKICSGQHHSIALDDKGNVFAFGRHEYGRLGLGNVKEDATQPKMIETFKGKKVVDISCGGISSFAITSEGKLYSWGMQACQLGQGSNLNGDIYEPKIVTSKLMDRFKALKVSTGSAHCLVLGQFIENENVNQKSTNGH